MNERKLIANALLDLAKNSSTVVIDASDDKELIEAANKFSITLPSPDLAILKTIYCEIDKVNRNGVTLSREAVEKGLHTLIGKQVNWEHMGSGQVCGYSIKAQIVEDRVEIIAVVFKSLFPEEFEKVQEKFQKGTLAVSFEIWNRNPETGESVVSKVSETEIKIDPIIFHGTGLLLTSKPACPNAFVYKLLAQEFADNQKVFNEDLIYAELSLEDPTCKGCNPCTCGKGEKTMDIIVEEVKAEEIIEEKKEEVAEVKIEEVIVEKIDSEIVDTTPEVKPEEAVEAKIEEPIPTPEETKEEVVAVAEMPVEVPVETVVTVVERVSERVEVTTEVPEDEGYRTETKAFNRVTIRLSDGRTEVTVTELDVVEVYSVAQVEEKIAVVKAELQVILEAKDKEVTQLKQELELKSQEIATLAIKEEVAEEPEMTVGSTDEISMYSNLQDEVNKKAFPKR